MDDRLLLRQFVISGDRSAFGEIVRRHIDLVYAAARRQVADSAAADDVTQTVFILLAQHARTIRDSEALAGWLLVATRRAALNVLRGEARRRHHEREAAVMNLEIQSDQSSAWESIRPLLDHAVADLKPADRDAITLRYFKRLSVSDVATALGVSQPAAQKRLGRAIERLRTLLARRGVAVLSAGVLETTVMANASMQAPAALLSQVMLAACNISRVGAVGSSITVSKGATILMAIKSKVTLVTTAVLILIAAVVTPVVYHFSHVSGMSTAKATVFEDVYGLKGQSIRRIAPPFAAVRTDFLLSENPSLANTKYGLPTAMIVKWTGGKPRLWGFTQSIPPHKYTVATLIHNVWLSPEWSLEGDETLKNMDIEGDLTVDAASNAEQRRAAIERILSEQVGKTVTLRFREVARPVFVFKGTWEYTPANSQPTSGNPHGPPRLELFVAHIDSAAEGGIGTLEETVKGISDNLEMTVLFECQGAPNELLLHSNAKTGDKPMDSLPHNRATVIKHLEQQTGLTATEETRTVRRLFVERG